MEPDSWAYKLLVRWVEDGAKGVSNPPKFDRLEVTPAEVVFDAAGKTTPLKVVAHWADGSSEDVTCLSRFRTNDEAVAEVSLDGVITSKGKGDTHVVAFYDNGVGVIQVLGSALRQGGCEISGRSPTPTKIDALVVAKLKKLGIVPSEVCTDAEFLRRVSIDLTGTLPTSKEVEAFLAETSPNKRDAKVDELLSLARPIPPTGRTSSARSPATALDSSRASFSMRSRRGSGTNGSRSGSARTCRMTSSWLGSCWRPAASQGRPTTSTSKEPFHLFPAREACRLLPARHDALLLVAADCEHPRREGAQLQPHVPGRPDGMRPVSQASVRPVDAGRFQAIHRLLHPGAVRGRARRTSQGRRDAERPGRRQAPRRPGPARAGSAGPRGDGHPLARSLHPSCRTECEWSGGCRQGSGQGRNGSERPGHHAQAARRRGRPALGEARPA